jgi:hypothetical protein
MKMLKALIKDFQHPDLLQRGLPEPPMSDLEVAGIAIQHCQPADGTADIRFAETSNALPAWAVWPTAPIDSHLLATPLIR